MKKINFEKLKIYLDVAHESSAVQNVKKDFANIVYSLGTGIECHALALKIYNSSGEEEYTDDECELIRRFAEKCTPAFIDAINENIG